MCFKITKITKNYCCMKSRMEFLQHLFERSLKEKDYDRQKIVLNFLLYNVNCSNRRTCGNGQVTVASREQRKANRMVRLSSCIL